MASRLHVVLRSSASADLESKSSKTLKLNGFRVFSCPEIFDGFSWRSMVFDRFFIVNEGLTAVFRAFIVNKWAKRGRAKSAFSVD